jgi:hypothetical protein
MPNFRQGGQVQRNMTKLNPALLEALARIENACRRVSASMVSAPNLSIKDIESVLLEIQEIRNAFEAFKAAVEAGDVAGFQNGSFRADGCT